MVVVVTDSVVVLASVSGGVGVEPDDAGVLESFLLHAVIATAGFIGAWALALLPSGAWPVTLSAIIGIAMGPPDGAIMALPARALALKNRSAGLGLFYSIHYAMTAAGPALAGYLRDLTGGATAAVIFGALFFLAALPLLMLFERLLRRR
jgi:MFS family permease